MVKFMIVVWIVCLILGIWPVAFAMTVYLLLVKQRDKY